MFRKPIRQGQRTRMLNPQQMTLLVQANQLLATGKPAEAAALFTQLAVALETERHPRRAANLHARAAHALADSQDEDRAVAQARQALTLFLQYQMTQRAAVFFANILRKLQAHDMKTAAGLLQREYSAQIGTMPAAGQAEQPAQRGLLPTQCPKCGGPVVGAEVNWVDERTAECEYCGALLRASV